MALDFRDLGLPAGPEHECPYLPDQLARERAFRIDRVPAGIYKSLMDFGWRRSGRILYKPACSACAACVPIRVPVAEFVPSRTQAKLWRRNANIQAHVGPPEATDEKFELFVRYQESRHTGTMCTVWEDFVRFLYESPVSTREVVFRDPDGSLLGVAIIDIDGGAVSSVYDYFEATNPRRSMGTWIILWLLDFCRTTGIPYYYPGYHIDGCRKMEYKTRFRPYELGDGEGRWSRREAVTAPAED